MKRSDRRGGWRRHEICSSRFFIEKMGRPGPATHPAACAFPPCACPRTRVPFRCSGGLHCGFIYSREPVCAFPLKSELACAAVPAPTVLAPPVLAPARASPSGAVAGSAAGSFTCVNPSAAFPLNYAPSTAVSGLAFVPLSAALPGRAFAPPSATIPGLRYAGDCTKSIFRAEITPGNALTRSRSSSGLRTAEQHVQRNTCFSDTC